MANAKGPVPEDQFLQFMALAHARLSQMAGAIGPAPECDPTTREVHEWLKANRAHTEAERLGAVKNYLREQALDVETLLHYAAAGFLAADAVPVLIERGLINTAKLAELTGAKFADVRTARARANGLAGGRNVRTEEIRESRARWIQEHGSKKGWIEVAKDRFHMSDRAIRDRLNPRKSPRASPLATK